jgi:hypothetical protein
MITTVLCYISLSPICILCRTLKTACCTGASSRLAPACCEKVTALQTCKQAACCIYHDNHFSLVAPLVGAGGLLCEPLEACNCWLLSHASHVKSVPAMGSTCYGYDTPFPTVATVLCNTCRQHNQVLEIGLHHHKVDKQRVHLSCRVTIKEQRMIQRMQLHPGPGANSSPCHVTATHKMGAGTPAPKHHQQFTKQGPWHLHI